MEQHVVGHSGGAATAAILLGLKPPLINAAVLVSCPCDLDAWRVGGRPWSASENPIKWTDAVSPEARMIAFTGDRDVNTSPALAQVYVEALAARQVKAEFRLLRGENHNSAFRSSEIFSAAGELIRSR